MEKQSYMKPFMVMEKFLPQEFVAGCDVPDRKYIVKGIAAIENDNKNGWSDGDNESYKNASNYWMLFDSYSYKYINRDTYPDDNHQNYYEYRLTSPAILVQINRHGNTYEYSRVTAIDLNVGSLFYSTSGYVVNDNRENNTHS